MVKAMPKKTKQTPDVYGTLRQPEFFSSGCLLFDKALSGGWCENRIINLIGDNSTGKTLLAIVACKTYHDKYPNRKITYIEAEQAFNPDFARNLGFDFNAMEFCDTIVTVEGLFEKLTARIEDDPEGLVVVDSLDALSTEEELEGEFSAGYHGARKAERMSSLFRQLNARLSKASVTVLIISQTRQKIGVVYGRKWTRAGGNALDFYASHRVILANIGKLVKTVSGIKRPIGIMTKAVVEKNKFGPSFREAEIPLLYDFGIDDERANINWLKKLKITVSSPCTREDIRNAASNAWDDLEQKFKCAPVETENATDNSEDKPVPNNTD